VLAWLAAERAQAQASAVPLAAVLEQVNVGGNARQTYLERFSATPAAEPFLASVGALSNSLRAELVTKGLDESEVRKWLAKGLGLRDELDCLRRLRRLMSAAIANAGAARHALTTMRKRTQFAKMDLRERARREVLADVVGREIVAPRARAAAAFDVLVRQILRGVRPETFAARYAAERLSRMFTMTSGRPYVGLVAALLKGAGLVPGGSICWNGMSGPACSRILPPPRKNRRRARVRAIRGCPSGRCALATESVEKMLRRPGRR
jgi:hypothetical protein